MPERLRDKRGNFARDKNVFQGSTSSYQRNSFQSAKRSNYVSCSRLEERCFLTFTTAIDELGFELTLLSHGYGVGEKTVDNVSRGIRVLAYFLRKFQLYFDPRLFQSFA